MRAFLFLAASLLATAVLAQQPGDAEAPLDEVVVTGEYPGPGLWRITRDGDAAAHVLWIVGDFGPLPKGLKWKSREIEAKVAGSQEILFDAGFRLAPDEKVGVLRGLTLIPAALEARRNPDDAKLVDVLPPPLYARWLEQKKLYLGRDSGVEGWRPLFAAQKLQKGLVDTLDLSPKETVYRKVRELAGKKKIKQTFPLVSSTFKRSELRHRMKEFARESLADVECLAVTLDLAEALARRDIENARHRAWARGDLAGLAALPELPNPGIPCTMAVMSAEAARDLVPADVEQLVTAQWLEAAEASLGANQSTFAVLPFAKLTRQGGYLDLLRAKGYRVEAPN